MQSSKSNSGANENLTLKAYEKKVKEDIRLINENLHELLKLFKIEDDRTIKINDEYGLNKGSQSDIDSFEVQIRTLNIVKSTESLAKIVSDLKDLTILNDFKSINAQLTNQHKFLKLKEHDVDRQLSSTKDFLFKMLNDLQAFFSIQPNEDTRRKQLEAWSDIILNYCQQKRLFQLDISEHQNTELFNNKKIDRKCSIELITMIIDYLAKNGKAEWDSPSDTKNSKGSSANLTRRKCFILWHTIDEWSKIIYTYVCKNALQNNVCTFYELIESDECQSEEFYQIDKNLFVKCISFMQQQRKAELINLNGDMGVKFF